MKACLASWGVALLGAAAALRRGAAKLDSGFWDGRPGVVKACDDFEAEDATIEGAITFLRPLICEKPLTLNVYNTTVVRSHDAINTTNVHFMVHPEATLTLKARVIVMGRDKVSTQPVVKVFGRVKLEAIAWTPSYVDGNLEDNGDVVRVLTGGGIDSNQPVHYTTSTFVVANEQARHENEPTIKLPPPLEGKLTDFHARLSTTNNAPDSDTGARTDIGSSSSDGGGGGGGSSRSSSSSGDGVTKHTDNPLLDSSSSGIEAARTASKDRPVPRHLTADHRVSKRVLDVFKKVELNQINKNNVVPNFLRGSARKDHINRHSMVCPSDPWVRKPTCALQVGKTLRGTLRSAEGKSAMWPGVDGSLRFGKYPAAPSADSGGEQGSGKGGMQFTTLLRSDSERAREVLGTRKRESRGESRNDTASVKRNKAGTNGGWFPGWRRAKQDIPDNDDKSEKLKDTAGGWLPWASRAKGSRSHEIMPTTTNAEEVCVTVSNKGCVKVTMDGTTVLSKSGRFKWDWLNRLPWARPKDEGYQVHVTETGMEVRLGERTVWGVDADEWMG